ncbi:hypothetical protein STIAU_3253 [Stigmatella aurantiaca DW4/3-1]|uniref:Uncharacterized protein n=1 Tax=Stigmatella aurantiaca (strain DW4/3-1) TaxID=378806 RepID=Q08X92_STIAD|nr:hypothetical protein STIAU_3253 [Stigmatella aurantiaca DW4/3-1]
MTFQLCWKVRKSGRPSLPASSHARGVAPLEDDLHAPVVGAALGGAVAGHRPVLAQAAHLDAVRRDALGDEKVAHALRPTEGEVLVEAVRALGIRVAFDGQPVVGGLQGLGHLRELGAGGGQQVVLPRGEEDAARERQHRAPRVLAHLQLALAREPRQGRGGLGLRACPGLALLGGPGLGLRARAPLHLQRLLRLGQPLRLGLRLAALALLLGQPVHLFLAALGLLLELDGLGLEAPGLGQLGRLVPQAPGLQELPLGRVELGLGLAPLGLLRLAQGLRGHGPLVLGHRDAGLGFRELGLAQRHVRQRARLRRVLGAVILALGLEQRVPGLRQRLRALLADHRVHRDALVSCPGIQQLARRRAVRNAPRHQPRGPRHAPHPSFPPLHAVTPLASAQAAPQALRLLGQPPRLVFQGHRLGQREGQPCVRHCLPELKVRRLVLPLGHQLLGLDQLLLGEGQVGGGLGHLRGAHFPGRAHGGIRLRQARRGRLGPHLGRGTRGGPERQGRGEKRVAHRVPPGGPGTPGHSMAHEVWTRGRPGNPPRARTLALRPCRLPRSRPCACTSLTVPMSCSGPTSRPGRGTARPMGRT